MSEVAWHLAPEPPTGDGPQVWVLPRDEGLAERVLGLVLGVPPNGVRIVNDVRGRPGVVGGGLGRLERLDLSLAHTPDLLALAVIRGGRIGVDLELPNPQVEPLSIATTHFTPAEAAALAALPDELRDAAFYRYWTAKEAMLKALGVGLSFGLDQVELGAEGEGLRLDRLSGSASLAEGWSLALRRVGEATVAVAWA